MSRALRVTTRASDTTTRRSPHGTLIDTLIVRSLVVPSAVLVIGPSTWWPSRLARESHELDEAAALEVAITGEEG